MASNYKTGASLNLTPFEMQLLSRSPLFRGAGESGIGEMLSCLGAEERSYEKEEMIYRAGNTVTSLGVVMHGSVMIVNDDLWETGIFQLHLLLINFKSKLFLNSCGYFLS